MRPRTLALALVLASASLLRAAEPNAKAFLRYVYGAEGVNTAEVCTPCEDLWMIRGERNAGALGALETLSFTAKQSGVETGIVPGGGLYYLEYRKGKVDPAFYLDAITAIQRKVVLLYLYSALAKDTSRLGTYTTHPANVLVDTPRPGPGDMDVYGEVLSQLPILRASNPAEDAKSHTITFRVPLGEEGFPVTLLKLGNTWKVDTSKPVHVPLGFFFRRN